MLKGFLIGFFFKCNARKNELQGEILWSFFFYYFLATIFNGKQTSWSKKQFF